LSSLQSIDNKAERTYEAASHQALRPTHDRDYWTMGSNSLLDSDCSKANLLLPAATAAREGSFGAVPLRIKRENLRLVERLGESRFGQVKHFCPLD